MSKFLSDTPLSDVLPPSIRNDESMQASLAGIEPQLSDSTARIAGLLLLSRLFAADGISENAGEVLQRIASLGEYRPLEENLLDLLAWQFHVDDYDIAKNYREKLEMVKASIQIHRKKGTKWAVKRAVEAALQDTELRIKEWFEPDYQGNKQPYHFKAELTVLGEELLSDHVLRAKRIIETTKSLRSHCNGITVAIGSQGEMKYGFCTAMANTMTIEPELVTELGAEENQSRQVQAMHTESILSVYPDEAEEIQNKPQIFILYPKR